MAHNASNHEFGGPILVTELFFRLVDGTPVELTINKNRANFRTLTRDSPNDIV